MMSRHASGQGRTPYFAALLRGLAIVCLTWSAAPQALKADAPFLRFEFGAAATTYEKVPQRAGMTRFLVLDAISLEGASGQARLVIELAMPPEAGMDAQPLDARVTYRPDGFVDFWQTITIPPDGFVFDVVELSGPSPRIAGSFALPLCERASIMVPADPARCQMAQGQFATDLQLD
jgi:hypothetical protein